MLNKCQYKYLIEYYVIAYYFKKQIFVFLYSIIVLFFIIVHVYLRALKKTMVKRQIRKSVCKNSKWDEKQLKRLAISTTQFFRVQLVNAHFQHYFHKFRVGNELMAFFEKKKEKRNRLLKKTLMRIRNFRMIFYITVTNIMLYTT